MSMKSVLARAERAVPRLVVGAAVAHTAVAVVASPSWRTIAEQGVWNTVANDDYPAMTTLWFTASGVGLLGLGLLSRTALRTTGTLPPELGWVLLAIGAPVSILEPISGGWLLTGIGLLCLAALHSRRRAPAADRSKSPADARVVPGKS